MKNILIAIVLFIFCNQLSFSQYRDIPSGTRTKIKKSGLILGFINPSNFSLSHSVNLSYYSGREYSLSTTSYTATLGYKLSDRMNLEADITLQYSPFSSVGNNSLNQYMKNSLNGVRLSRVSFNYRPSENMFINVQYLNYNNSLFLNDNYFNNIYYTFRGSERY